MTQIDPLYAPASWVAARLGISRETLRKRMAEFRAAGLPEPCPITGLYLMAAIDAWAMQRHGIGAAIPQPTRRTEANLNAI